MFFGLAANIFVFKIHCEKVLSLRTFIDRFLIKHDDFNYQEVLHKNLLVYCSKERHKLSWTFVVGNKFFAFDVLWEAKLFN